MEAEQKVNALRFCLQCENWKVMKIDESGWWRPLDCEFWNSAKGTEEKPYGPMNGCRYKLEHYLLDNRLGFKLVNGESFMPLVEFAEKYLNLKWCSEKKGKYKVRFMHYARRNGNGRNIYITKEEAENEVIVADIVSWANNIMRKGGYRKLTHTYKYDKIKKTKRGGQWEYEQIEENAEKKK